MTNNASFRIIQSFVMSATVTQKMVGILMLTTGNDGRTAFARRRDQIEEAEAALDRLQGKVDAMRQMVSDEQDKHNWAAQDYEARLVAARARYEDQV